METAMVRRAPRTHVTVLEGSYLSIKWLIVQAKLGHGRLGDFELVTTTSLSSADVRTHEYIRGIRDDVFDKLSYKKLSLKPHFTETQSEVGYNGSPAFLLATFSEL